MSSSANESEVESSLVSWTPPNKSILKIVRLAANGASALLVFTRIVAFSPSILCLILYTFFRKPGYKVQFFSS